MNKNYIYYLFNVSFLIGAGNFQAMEREVFEVFYIDTKAIQLFAISHKVSGMQRKQTKQTNQNTELPNQTNFELYQ